MSEKELCSATMYESIHNGQPCVANRATFISNGEPAELVLGIASNIIVSTLVILVGILYQLFHRALRRIRKMQVDNARTFPFARYGDTRDGTLSLPRS